MSCRLPPVYPILNIDAESEQDWAEAMLVGFFSAGIDLVQLRGKGLSDADYLKWALYCRARCTSAGARLIINDRVEIAEMAGAHGVHLGQTDLPPAIVREHFREDLIIGYSCHSFEQIRATQEFRSSLSYLAIGPIFETSSKQNADPVVGLGELTRIREALTAERCELPLVAIGGIELDNIRELRSRGADSVAMISALGNESEVEGRAKEAMRLAT